MRSRESPFDGGEQQRAAPSGCPSPLLSLRFLSPLPRCPLPFVLRGAIGPGPYRALGGPKGRLLVSGNQQGLLLRLPNRQALAQLRQSAQDPPRGERCWRPGVTCRNSLSSEGECGVLHKRG